MTVYFDENTTFAEQISFFASTDILISPHGAQLVGIPFMPDCGAVFEIFPAGYYFPYYFGSLASAAGLNHAFLSITNTGDWEAESIHGMQNRETRQYFRNHPLCPDLDNIVDAVQRLVLQRKQCLSYSA
jgi:hypothetical protein